MAPHIPPPPEQFPMNFNYIAGSLIAGVVILVVLLCLLCLVRFQRSKANKKRSAARFRVKGVIRSVAAETNPPSTRSVPPFSRSRITASIIMPEKSITRKPHSYELSDKAGVSPEFTPSFASSTLSTHLPLPNASPAPPSPHAISILNPAHPRHTRSSSGFSGYSQYHFPQGLSSRPSSASSAPSSHARPVHQPFEPTLCDELALRCGEYLTVLRSFDDGWCIVARDTSRTSLLPTGMKDNEDNVDIGLVPAWIFSKPLEGVVSKRPFRSASLNALHLGQNPTYGRDWIASWSHFA